MVFLVLFFIFYTFHVIYMKTSILHIYFISVKTSAREHSTHWHIITPTQDWKHSSIKKSLRHQKNTDYTVKTPRRKGKAVRAPQHASLSPGATQHLMLNSAFLQGCSTQQSLIACSMLVCNACMESTDDNRPAEPWLAQALP